jgi:transposase
LYQPRFSPAEIAQAQAWACSQALPHSEVQRARLVLLLDEQPDLRSPEAARRLGQSTSWVCKWRRRWVEEGFSLADAPRRGRPRRLLEWMRALVIAIACELPSQRGLALGRHCASSIWQVATSEGIQISIRSVQRILKANALKPWQ